MSGRPRRDQGQAGGAEVLALGILVLVGGLLLGVNAWSVFSTRMTADAVAREYLRAYTEADGPAAARTDGRAAAAAVIQARSLEVGRVELTEPSGFVACASVTVGVAIAVPQVRIPFLGGVGATTVTVTHRERVDAYRAGPALAPAERPACTVP